MYHVRTAPQAPCQKMDDFTVHFARDGSSGRMSARDPHGYTRALDAHSGSHTDLPAAHTDLPATHAGSHNGSADTRADTFRRRFCPCGQGDV